MDTDENIVKVILPAFLYRESSSEVQT